MAKKDQRRRCRKDRGDQALEQQAGADASRHDRGPEREAAFSGSRARSKDQIASVMVSVSVSVRESECG